MSIYQLKRDFIAAKMTNSVIKRHLYGFSGGENVGFYLNISDLTLSNFFFSVYVLNIVKNDAAYNIVVIV